MVYQFYVMVATHHNSITYIKSLTNSRPLSFLQRPPSNHSKNMKISQNFTGLHTIPLTNEPNPDNHPFQERNKRKGKETKEIEICHGVNKPFVISPPHPFISRLDVEEFQKIGSAYQSKDPTNVSKLCDAKKCRLLLLLLPCCFCC